MKFFGAALAVGILLFAFWPWLAGNQLHHRTIVVYGFSILAEAIDHSVFPVFQAEWRQRKGEQVELISSYSGSGTVTNQIRLGVPAQIAILALELDAQKLATEKIIPADNWSKLPQKGVVNRTPFVMLVRPGNPKRIRDFSDLARPGVRIVHPDPLTSGGAQWAILAEYGSALRTTRDAALAERQLLGIWKNVVAQAGSARAARTQFESGFGDVLITYEQDLLADPPDGEIVYPSSTILSEHVVVTVEKNVPPRDSELVGGFVQFLWSESGQKAFVKSGFRSMDDKLNGGFHKIEKPFTVADLGGWPKAKQEIVDNIWKNRVLPEVGR